MLTQEKTLEEEKIQLVVERLKTIPNDKKLSIGNKGDFTIGELIERVKANDEVGQKVVKIQMEFLQSLKTGALLDE
jgi:hypothetical protein